MSFPQTPATVLMTRSGVVHGRVDCQNAAQAQHTAILFRDRFAPGSAVLSVRPNVYEVILPVGDRR